MNNREIHSFEMILRVSDFGVQQAASFPPDSLGTELFATVKTAATELGNHIAQQTSGRLFEQEGTASKAVGRAALVEALERFRRTARSISETMPEVAAKFRLPRNIGDQELLGVAQAVATDAIPLKSEFLRYAMPLDFLEELGELTEEFRTALTTQQTGRASRLSASAAIEDTLDEALSAVRRLDSIVRNTFADDPVRLSAWTTARHVQRERRRSAPSQAPQATAQPSTPPASPTSPAS